jgi:hypothetical protein
MTEYERFGLVITKTLVYKFGYRCRAKFLVPDWGIWNIVDSGIGLSYNPTSESTISPSQGLRIWLQITMTESERFGLVFAKTDL